VLRPLNLLGLLADYAIEDNQAALDGVNDVRPVAIED
jgi:hypothetical protein